MSLLCVSLPCLAFTLPRLEQRSAALPEAVVLASCELLLLLAQSPDAALPYPLAHLQPLFPRSALPSLQFPPLCLSALPLNAFIEMETTWRHERVVEVRDLGDDAWVAVGDDLDALKLQQKHLGEVHIV